MKERHASPPPLSREAREDLPPEELLAQLEVPAGVEIQALAHGVEISWPRRASTSKLERALSVLLATLLTLWLGAMLLPGLQAADPAQLLVGLLCSGPPWLAVIMWVWSLGKRRIRMVVDERGLHVHDGLLSSKRTRLVSRDEIARVVMLGPARSNGRRLLALGPQGQRRLVLAMMPDWRLTHFLLTWLGRELGVPVDDRARPTA